MGKMYKVCRGQSALGIEGALLLGLRSFGDRPQETAIFRVWCALQICDEVDKSLPGLKYHSLQAVLRELESMGWIVVDDNAGIVEIII